MQIELSSIENLHEHYFGNADKAVSHHGEAVLLSASQRKL